MWQQHQAPPAPLLVAPGGYVAPPPRPMYGPPLEFPRAQPGSATSSMVGAWQVNSDRLDSSFGGVSSRQEFSSLVPQLVAPATTVSGGVASANLATAAAQAMGFTSTPAAVAPSIPAADPRRPPSPPRLLSWTAPPVSPRVEPAPADREADKVPLQPAHPDQAAYGVYPNISIDNDQWHSEKSEQPSREKQDPSRQAQENQHQLSQNQEPEPAKRSPLLGRRETSPGRVRFGPQRQKPSTSSTVGGAASGVESKSPRRSPRSGLRPISPRCRMGDVLFNQLSPTRHPETARRTQSPRPGFSTQWLAACPPPRSGGSGRFFSKSSSSSSLHAGSRPASPKVNCGLSSSGSTSSLRQGLAASDDTVAWLLSQQKDEHAEERIDRLIVQAQSNTHRWSTRVYHSIREDLRNPAYRDATKSFSSLARRVKS